MDDNKKIKEELKSNIIANIDDYILTLTHNDEYISLDNIQVITYYKDQMYATINELLKEHKIIELKPRCSGGIKHYIKFDSKYKKQYIYMHGANLNIGDNVMIKSEKGRYIGGIIGSPSENHIIDIFGVHYIFSNYYGTYAEGEIIDIGKHNIYNIQLDIGINIMINNNYAEIIRVYA